jgi:hypothetical protein
MPTIVRSNERHSAESELRHGPLRVHEHLRKRHFAPQSSLVHLLVRPPEVTLLNKLVFENLRQRPVRTCLSVLAIGVEVTMILTLVGVSYGTLDETARRAPGVGADIVVRPPASSIISLSSSPMSEKLVPFLMKQPHVPFATGTMGQPLGGFDVLTGIDLAQFNRLSGGKSREAQPDLPESG